MKPNAYALTEVIYGGCSTEYFPTREEAKKTADESFAALVEEGYISEEHSDFLVEEDDALPSTEYAVTSWTLTAADGSTAIWSIEPVFVCDGKVLSYSQYLEGGATA